MEKLNHRTKFLNVEDQRKANYIVNSMKAKYITTQRGLKGHNNVIIINDRGEVLCYSLSSSKESLIIDKFNRSKKYQVGTHSPTGLQAISLAFLIEGVNQNEINDIIIEA